MNNKNTAGSSDGGTKEEAPQKIKHEFSDFPTPATQTVSSVQSSLPKTEVDRLREILFGTQIQEYERQFIDLRRVVERVQNDMRLLQERITDFEKTQNKRLNTLDRETQQSFSQLNREVERLRGQEKMLKQLINQTRQQELTTQEINKNHSELKATLTQHGRDIQTVRTSIGEQTELHDRRIDGLKREFRQVEDNLWQELRQITDRLSDQKMDRKTLAGMFMEIATRIETGNSVTGLLEELSNASE